MWNRIKKFISGSGLTPIGELALTIREAIKGKEVDPNEALRMINELNKAEAQHRSIFVAGARPFILWVCGVTLAYHYVLQPFIIYLMVVNGYSGELPPTLELGELWPLISGLLGIAGMRSYDKMKKTSG